MKKKDWTKNEKKGRMEEGKKGIKGGTKEKRYGKD